MQQRMNQLSVMQVMHVEACAQNSDSMKMSMAKQKDEKDKGRHENPNATNPTTVQQQVLQACPKRW